ncbi:methyl-accepting chemotaxis protein [Niallia sp. Krafla_26]|uniref:methyl-accepting chemotaxis protein n=1 Tax=Niallia sp. Krafla_26 TaxID=3064703 RepID=UPI003D175543
MFKKPITLRKQFLTQIIAILVVISILSSGIQLYLMIKQVDYEIETQTTIIANSVNQGIEETDLASKSIEHQIDLKMVGYLEYIASMLDKKKAEDISDQELSNIKEKLELAGLAIFERKNDDIVIVKSTDPKEVGFSGRDYGEMIYSGIDSVMKGEDLNIPGVLSKKGLVILPLMQSGTYKDEPQFFKYAYYHPEGTDYIINPYIQADEIYKFTKNVGTDSWISEMEQDSSFVLDISVLNPEVFYNPSLENQFWPPVKKVVYGDYQYQSEKDHDFIIGMIDNPIKQSYVDRVKGGKTLKLFLPQENGHIIHIVFDYEKMIEPLKTQFIILVITGVISLVSLFVLIFKLFSKIYFSIQKISHQIHLLEGGDLTAVSQINDGTELTHLSEAINSMANKLNHLLKEAQKQAIETQNLSLILEEDASHSVEKIYELSTEATIQAREQLYELMEFFDYVEEVILPHQQKNEGVQKIMKKIDTMREIAKKQASGTTNTTITLSDLLNSLHEQSRELSEISSALLEQMSKFKL